jgi:hypothetical protein
MLKVREMYLAGAMCCAVSGLAVWIIPAALTAARFSAFTGPVQSSSMGPIAIPVLRWGGNHTESRHRSFTVQPCVRTLLMKRKDGDNA